MSSTYLLFDLNVKSAFEHKSHISYLPCKTLPSSILVSPLCTSSKLCKEAKKGDRRQKALKIGLSSEMLAALRFDKLSTEWEEHLERLANDLHSRVRLKVTINAIEEVFVRVKAAAAPSTLSADVAPADKKGVRPVPLGHLAQIVSKGPDLVLVDPGANAHLIPDMTAAITASGLNVEIQKEAATIFLRLPKLTTEKRRELVKSAAKLTNETKNRMRESLSRHERILKRLDKEGLPVGGAASVEADEEPPRSAPARPTATGKGGRKLSSDDVKLANDFLIGRMKEFAARADALLKAKEKELMDN